MSAGTIRIDGLTRRFGAHVAVKPFRLTLGPGGIIGLLGPNGSGKSTLLRMLLGLVPPDAGRAEVDGVALAGDGVAIRRRTSYLPGELHLYGELSGRAHLAWCLRGRAPAALARAHELAAAFELPLARRVRGYSHGMKRQLLLAAALAPDVRVRVLDEPTEGLDPTRRAQVLELLRADAARGTTLLVSSHHLGEVERATMRQLFLRQGELLDEESARDLYRRARESLRVTWDTAPARDVLERAVSGVPGAELYLAEGRATFFFRSGGGLAALRALLATTGLPEPRAIAYGELSLAEVYRALYGVEGV
ncbi:MAG TPA: ATP-binding cassette domain-containing protein [Planctomycetota bacterium]